MADDEKETTLAFDREKWNSELEIRRAELEIKREELSRSKWSSPLVVAIIAATLAGLANLVVTTVSGWLQLQTQNEKAEDTRILEMIKTGDKKAASGNLRFLVDTGLISDQGKVDKITAYLAKNPEGGPVLPSPSERYSISNTGPISNDLQHSMQAGLETYISYLDKLGFSKPAISVLVRVSDQSHMLPDWLSYYNPPTNEIVLRDFMATDPDIYRREYGHFVILRNWSGYILQNATARIESDLSDYFVCSFAGRPEFGSASAKYVRPGSPYFRTLAAGNVFGTAETSAGNDSSEVWGGLFWAIRQSIGQDQADILLSKAWQAIIPSEAQAHIESDFTTALVGAAKESLPPASVESVTALLRERHFPLSL